MEKPIQQTFGFDVPEKLHKDEFVRTCLICGTAYIFHDWKKAEQGEEYINACCRKHWIQLFAKNMQHLGYSTFKLLCDINGIKDHELTEAGIVYEN